MTFRPRWLPFVLSRYARYLVGTTLAFAMFQWGVSRTDPIHRGLEGWSVTVLVAATVSTVATLVSAVARSWLVRTSALGIDVMASQPIRAPWPAVQWVEISTTALRVHLRPTPVVRNLWSIRQPASQPFRELRISLRLLDPARSAQLRHEVDRWLARYS